MTIQHIIQNIQLMNVKLVINLRNQGKNVPFTP